MSTFDKTIIFMLVTTVYDIKGWRAGVTNDEAEINNKIYQVSNVLDFNQFL